MSARKMKTQVDGQVDKMTLGLSLLPVLFVLFTGFAELGRGTFASVGGQQRDPSSVQDSETSDTPVRVLMTIGMKADRNVITAFDCMPTPNIAPSRPKRRARSALFL